MSLGRKKTKTKVVKVEALPPITRVETVSPTGDRFITQTQGGVQTFQSQLAPETQVTVQESLKGLQQLAQSLNQPDAARQNAIDQRSQDFFDLQAKGINADADAQLAQTRVNLAKRFGGAYNATFGVGLLNQLQQNRLSQLSDAHKQAALLGENLYQQDEDSRIRRFSLFQNYIADLNNQARGLQSNGSGVLLSETQRASDLAVQKANLAINASNNDAAASAEQARISRQNALQASSAVVAALLAV